MRRWWGLLRGGRRWPGARRPRRSGPRGARCATCHCEATCHEISTIAFQCELRPPTSAKAIDEVHSSLCSRARRGGVLEPKCRDKAVGRGTAHVPRALSIRRQRKEHLGRPHSMGAADMPLVHLGWQPCVHSGERTARTRGLAVNGYYAPAPAGLHPVRRRMPCM